MCAAAIIPALIGAAATAYSVREQRKSADAAREQTERQMEQARQQAASPVQQTETNADVTAAVQTARKRAAAASGMGSTITGAGTSYSMGYGNKSKLGM